MALFRRKAVMFIISSFIILLLFAFVSFIQLQDVGWEEDVIYTGDGPYWKYEEVAYGGKQVAEDGTDEHDVNHVDVDKLDIKYPIILWWTGFTGERGKVKKCGQDKCFFTVDRHFQHHPNTRAFVFYGTDFKPEDVPVPRKAQHEWGLFHEESPKNNYMLSHPDCLTLFNHTATFRRVADFPLTTQYLSNVADLESKKFVVSLEEKKKTGLAPVVYVQSDCNPPSDRDRYVQVLMKYIPVDSYGACVHNKNLPADLTNPLTMEQDSFYNIMAKYKFTLAFENAICEDYITEKLWRPLVLGSVPVYRGSPSVRDWLPDNQSAIIADDFQSPQQLAAFLKYLDSNDEEYEKYLTFKQKGVTNLRLIETMKNREWGVNDYTKINFVDGFECLICNRLHENIQAKKRGDPEVSHIAKPDHYSCPRPQPFGQQPLPAMDLYTSLYEEHLLKAKVFRQLVLSGSNFTSEQFSGSVFKLLTGGRRF